MECGGLPCCRRARTRDSGKSKVVLGYTGPTLPPVGTDFVNNSGFCLPVPGPKHDKSGKALSLRHVSRFGITSFIYQARRPFHPERFDAEFVDKFFVYHAPDDSDEENENAAKKNRG